MERGLLWLPLLCLFIWLTWAGWNEYQKLEAYKTWATQFERAKYDIYAALGQSGDQLTWGVPTRQGPTQLQTLNYQDIQQLNLTVAGTPIAAETATPPKGRIALRLALKGDQAESIPFTDWGIAQSWYGFLAKQIEIEAMGEGAS
ncbi:MAG: hypothetical protein AAGF01_29010 [Cyanobacteria bacterium P01_G01_bin.38]